MITHRKQWEGEHPRPVVRHDRRSWFESICHECHSFFDRVNHRRPLFFHSACHLRCSFVDGACQSCVQRHPTSFHGGDGGHLKPARFPSFSMKGHFPSFHAAHYCLFFLFVFVFVQYFSRFDGNRVLTNECLSLFSSFFLIYRERSLIILLFKYRASLVQPSRCFNASL